MKTKSKKTEVILFGDLHNHCNISYAHGSLKRAIAFSKLSLDFVSITGHAGWPDMNTKDPSIKHIIDFHKVGFKKVKVMDGKNINGFIYAHYWLYHTFPLEWYHYILLIQIYHI